MKYKVGDMVGVRMHKLGTCSYPNCPGFIEEMVDLVGKKFKVTDYGFGRYLLDCGLDVAFSTCMLHGDGKDKKQIKRKAKRTLDKKTKIKITDVSTLEYICVNGAVYQKVWGL